MSGRPSEQPLNLALANDHELVVLGLAQMLAPFSDRIRIVEMVAGVEVTEPVDVTLYDTFTQPQVDAEDIDRVIGRDGAGKVVVYTWNVQPVLVQTALRKGARGYLSKRMTGAELVGALESIHRGEVVVGTEEFVERPDAGRWPGQTDGLTVRESEVIALITMGLSNQEIASRSYLSINSVKSYIRSAYRKMGVTTRAQAVLWGVEHGFLPDTVRYRREIPVT
jgi:DNA-binding NarL/FixJ family response regulator